MISPEDARKTTDTGDLSRRVKPASSNGKPISNKADSSIGLCDLAYSKQDNAGNPSTVQRQTSEQAMKEIEYDFSYMTNPSGRFILVTSTVAVMEGLFGGLVIQGADGSTPARASRYLEVETDDEHFGGDTQEVIEKALMQVHSSTAKAKLREKAHHLAISCGEISITWQRGKSTYNSGLSGFWIDHHGKYFVTALHFLDQMQPQLKSGDPKVALFRDESKCHVNSSLRGNSQSQTIKVKLKSWEWTSDTAIFEPIDPNAIIRCSIDLDDIGHFERRPKQQVFTVGYCGEDYPVTLEDVVISGQANNVSTDDIGSIYKRLQGGQHKQEVTEFQFLKEYYRVKLGSYPLSIQDRDKDSYLGAGTFNFKDVFIPHRRAAAAGYIGVWDPRTAKRTDETHTFGQMTDISLFHGLSGSPIIGFVDRRWQIIAKVRGGRFDALYNDLTAFKESYRQLIAKLIGR